MVAIGRHNAAGAEGSAGHAEASSALPAPGGKPVAAPGFCVVNLGCKVNRAESDTMAASCMAAGGVSRDAGEADVAIVNTCTVTAEADAKTRKAVRKLLRGSSCPVVVTGCAAAMHAEELAALGQRVVVEPSRLKASQMAVDVLTASAKKPQAFSAQSPDAVRLRATSGFKTRMDIKIQDGCNNACTYCIVHVARGSVTSLTIAEVAEQVKSAHASGVGEVVLTGINLGCFNDGGARLPDLLEALMLTSIERVRISSIEPPHIDSRLVQVMAANPQRICAHLHVPLQSGCDRTLAAMHRLYDTREFARRIAMVREACPGLSLTTDVIVGFPQETHDDFSESLDFCRSMRFSKMHVFRYSRREGTLAAQMPGQVPPNIAAARAKEMRDLSDQMRNEDAFGRVGHPERLLMMSRTLGMAQSYHEVVMSDPQTAGRFVDVMIDGVRDDGRLTAHAR